MKVGSLIEFGALIEFIVDVNAGGELGRIGDSWVVRNHSV